MNNLWILLGSISCALCVIIGAFGAHALNDVLDEYRKDIYQTATLYHFFHSIALIINGILAFSLYALAITNIKILGAITPIGGICFIVGWIYIAFQSYNS